MMTIDEALKWSDKIYDLSYELENSFFDWDTYPFEQRAKIYENPVFHDCILHLVHASAKLKEYALGFKEMQFAQ